MSFIFRPVALFSITAALLAAEVPAQTPASTNAPAKRAKWKWEQMDNGRFFSSNIEGKTPVLKAVTIKLGGEDQAAVAFDTRLLRMAVGWKDGFLRLPRGRDGLEGVPQVEGTPVFSTPNAPGWAEEGAKSDAVPEGWARWGGIYQSGDKVVLSYRIGGKEFLELPGFSEADGLKVFTRTVEAKGVAKPLVLTVFQEAKAKLISSSPQLAVFEVETASGPEYLAAALRGGGASIRATPEGKAEVAVPASRRGQSFQVAVWRGPKADLAKFQGYVAQKIALPKLAALCKGGPAQWPETIATPGVLGKDDGPYTVDTIPIPENNPWKAWMRLSGLDFFSDPSKAALCSVSGDVWIVSGIDAKLDKVTWKRFATGLFQPLGLKVVKDKVYVLGRDQITRLHDLNKDGEADYYENFNNDITITKEYHEFCLDLQTDSEGNFYFAKGGNLGPAVLPHHGCLVKVSKDGSKMEVVATGLRAPNGMGMGPNNEITVSDNEGNWVPASRVNLVKPGGFYGHVFTAHRKPDPTDYDKPLFWLPKNIDNSSGGQVWVTSDKWGPFQGDMLHMSYGTCSLFKVLQEEVDGQHQGGVVRFPLRFESGVMRARFNPRDGQLYTCGLVVWQSNGAKQGCFQRVRHTGKPANMPKEMHVTSRGIEIQFTHPLDKAAAEDTQNYAIEQWNYKWTKEYGSPEFSVVNPDKKGRDPVELKSVKLSNDRKTVFLEIADVKPVMQMRIKFDIKAADGAPITQEINTTINKVAQR